MNYELGDKMSLKEEFIKLGYTEDDYNEIRNSYPLINIKDETLSIHLKDILPTLSEEEQLELLSTNGMLVKRPILETKDKVLVGFKEEQYKELL